MKSSRMAQPSSRSRQAFLRLGHELPGTPEPWPRARAAGWTAPASSACCWFNPRRCKLKTSKPPRGCGSTEWADRCLVGRRRCELDAEARGRARTIREAKTEAGRRYVYLLGPTSSPTSRRPRAGRAGAHGFPTAKGRARTPQDCAHTLASVLISRWAATTPTSWSRSAPPTPRSRYVYTQRDAPPRRRVRSAARPRWSAALAAARRAGLRCLLS